MRLFQNSVFYRAYAPRLKMLTQGCDTFERKREAFLADRSWAAHYLKPVLDRDPDAFFANGGDPDSQRTWAREKGLAADTSLEDILLAQIEEHRTEIFYNLDPMHFGDDFLARLPGSVRKTIAWRAAPSDGGRFLKHDLIVNNFPSILADYRSQGVAAEYFTPAHDPEMDALARNVDRPIDVLFVGGYSQYHRRRAQILEAAAGLRGRANVVMHLDASRLVRLAETPFGLVGPLAKHRRPAAIRAVARPAVFGRDFLGALSQAKIVINGAIDMAGDDRGNMRVWETLGCGAALVTDTGRYPDKMRPGEDFLTYGNIEEMLALVTGLLDDEPRRQQIASTGYSMISTEFSKDRQWEAFKRLAA